MSRLRHEHKTEVEIPGGENVILGVVTYITVEGDEVSFAHNTTLWRYPGGNRLAERGNRTVASGGRFSIKEGTNE